MLANFANLTRFDADKGNLSHGIGLRRLLALASPTSTDGIPLALPGMLPCWRPAHAADREH